MVFNSSFLQEKTKNVKRISGINFIINKINLCKNIL
jgi:hypothetical protein